MPRRTRIPAPQAKAEFVGALRRGAPVVAAAAGTGVALWTYYRWRKADPEFDSAWAEAAKASSGWEFRPEAAAARAGGLVRAKRRLRFGAEAKAAVLAEIAQSCNLDDSARGCAIDPTTVRRHRRRDPAFASDFAAALERGFERLEALAAEERAEAAKLWARRVGPEPGARPPAGFDEQMRLLMRWRRPDGTIGPRKVRHSRLKSMTFEAAMELLARRLRSLRIALVPEAAGPCAPEPGG